MKEIWKDIKGYEGLYKVSNLGRIFSYKSNKYIAKGEIDPDIDYRFRQGYKLICLYKNKEKRCVSVHRVVAMAFVPNPNNYPIVNHKDANRTNNQASNLEWCTQKMNVAQTIKMKRHGTMGRWYTTV